MHIQGVSKLYGRNVSAGRWNEIRSFCTGIRVTKFSIEAEEDGNNSTNSISIRRMIALAGLNRHTPLGFQATPCTVARNRGLATCILYAGLRKEIGQYIHKMIPG